MSNEEKWKAVVRDFYYTMLRIEKELFGNDDYFRGVHSGLSRSVSILFNSLAKHGLSLDEKQECEHEYHLIVDNEHVSGIFICNKCGNKKHKDWYYENEKYKFCGAEKP